MKSDGRLGNCVQMLEAGIPASISKSPAFPNLHLAILSHHPPPVARMDLATLVRGEKIKEF